MLYCGSQTEYLDSGIDNIEVDPATGDLWIGSHPINWKIIDVFGILGATNAPCQVRRHDTSIQCQCCLIVAI